MVSNSAKLDRRTKQHTEFGVSASNGSRDMGRTKVAEKKKRKKNERRQSHKASPTGIANYSVMMLKLTRRNSLSLGVRVGRLWFRKWLSSPIPVF